MCDLVTIGTREDRAQVEALLGVDFSLALRPSKDPSLRSAFPQADGVRGHERIRFRLETTGLELSEIGVHEGDEP
jgi:hypothetical protein